MPTAEDSVAQVRDSELSPPSAKLPPPGIHYRRGLGLRKEIIEPLTETTGDTWSGSRAITTIGCGPVNSGS